MKLAIFDLDGTLNTSNKRGEFIPTDPTVNENWLRWHQAFKLEKLNTALISTASALNKAGYQIAIVSNRDESLARETYLHLCSNGFPPARTIFRQQKDNRKPCDWKADTIKLLCEFTAGEVQHFDDDAKAIKKLTDLFKGKQINYIPLLINWE